ncbi:MAG: hypothetical protein IKD22_04390 [Lentisphaeria bacterium]|nr:hypothetical protein [Lentisphaeria bacterium]
MRLSALFSDGVVLQREKNIPVWGFEAVPGALISAEMEGKKVYCRASASGDFMLRLPPFAAGGPYTLTVNDEEHDDKVTVEDVLVGEVWLASGQSNMQYELAADIRVNKDKSNDVNVRQAEEFYQLNQGDSQLRMFRVTGRELSGMREREYSGTWAAVTPESAKTFSAVGAWFAYWIKQKLNIPLGIVMSAVGGTRIEAWTSREMLMNRESGRKLLQIQDALGEKKKVFLKQEPCELTAKTDPGNTGFGKGFAAPEFDDSAWDKMLVPGSWIRQCIAGNGAVWIRRKVTLPAHWAGKAVTLHLGSVDKQDISYFNGVEVGRTGKDRELQYHSTPRAYPIAPELVHEGENTIAIRGFSFIYDGAFGNDDNTWYLELAESGEKLYIYGTWRAEAEFDWGCVGMSFGGLQNNAPSILFDNRLHPLIPFAIRGFLWYQGESNSGTMTTSAEYRYQMQDMIRDWRFRWGDGELPFIMVLLAGYGNILQDLFYFQSTWAQCRESQLKVCKEMANVYSASAVDIGDAKDIHPQNKKDVGYRMAQQALHNVYGFADVVPDGPCFKSAVVEGDCVRVEFDFADGLHFAAKEANGFWLAAADGEVHFADRIGIDGNSVTVSSSQVKAPVAIYYNWSDMPTGNLYNGAGLPCNPFRWQAK